MTPSLNKQTSLIPARIAPLSAWIVLIGALIMTLWTWNSFRVAVKEERMQMFDLKSASILENITDRLQVHEQVLKGALGLLAATEKVTREDWHEYASSLRLDEHYPGLQTLGYSEYIQAENVQKHIQAVRAEGYPDYEIHPKGDREQYTAVTLLEPSDDKSSRLLGFDMFSEPVRQGAMLHARDTGLPSITTKISLLHDKASGYEDSVGFLMFLPTYRYGMPISTVEERRTALQGYVFGIFNINVLMDNILHRQATQSTVHIYDGLVTEPSRLFYSTHQTTEAQAEPKPSSHTRKLILETRGNKWTLVVRSTPEFLEHKDYTPWLVLIAGLALSFLLYMIVWHITRSRNEALTQLKAFKREHELLLNSAGEGIFGLDINGKCTFVNPMAASLLGWETQQLVGTLNHELIHHSHASGEKYIKKECPIQATLTDGEVRSVDTEVFWRKDGTSMPVAYTSTPIRDDENNVQGAVVTFEDITERKHAEQHLRESELRFRQIAETVQEVFWICSPDAKQMIYLSPAFEQIWGRPRDEVYDKPALWLEFLHTDDKETCIQAFSSQINAGNINLEYRILRPDGSIRWIHDRGFPVHDDHGKIYRIAGTASDITERKLAEQALQISEERNRRIVDTAHDAFIAIDEQGLITEWNPQAEHILGWKHHDAIGRHLSYMVIPKRFRQAHIDGMKHFLKTGEAPVLGQLLELTAVHMDGHELPVEITISLMQLDEGYMFGAFLRDITERKESEEKLAEKTDELTRSNQELQQFASVASHDLQEPLRKIQAFSERLKKADQDRLSEDGLKYLGRVLEASSRMRILINDLLSYSRVSTHTEPFTTVDLNVLAKEVLSDLEASIESAEAMVEIPTLPTIQADPMQMRQLFQNLIGNAIKFSRHNVTPVVKVFSKHHEGEDTENGICDLHFEDNGIGIEEKYAEKIFQPFERLHGREDYKGTGIGLAICQKIANRHGGSIRAVASPETGATFIVTLPLKQPETETNDDQIG